MEFAYDYLARQLPKAAGTGMKHGTPMEKDISKQVKVPVTADTYEITANYNVTDAIWYAYEYTENGLELESPDYIRFAEDCTNFVSQCLHYGGISMIDEWYRPSDSYLDWYYHMNSPDTKSDDTWGTSWVNAHVFYQHLLMTGLGTKLEYDYQLQPGDVVQADWEGDGNINHTAIVTKVENGKVYLTYHSVDREDYLLDNWYKLPNFPDVRVHGWRINPRQIGKLRRCLT